MKNVFKSKYIIPLVFAIISMLFFFLSADNSINPEKCGELGLPVLFVDTYAGKKISSKEKYVEAAFEIENFSGGCKIRGHGNTTWKTRELYKRPYLLKLDIEQPLLGMKSERKWLLLANTADSTSLRNVYAFHLASEIWTNSGWIPESKFVTLFLNGKYNGLYLLMEKIEFGDNRISLPEGSFLAVANSRLNKEWNFKTNRGVPVSIRMENFSTEDYKSMQEKIQDMEDVLFSDNFKSKTAGYETLIDTKSFIDWYLVNEFTKNHDARLNSSCYFYYNSADKKFYMTTPYDFDLSCGNVGWDDACNPDGFWVKQGAWYERLLSDEDFSKAVAKRWFEKRKEIEKSFDWLSERAEFLKPAVELNDSVWRNIGRRQWPHAPGRKQRKTFESEVDYMMNFLKMRAEWMDKNLGA